MLLRAWDHGGVAPVLAYHSIDADSSDHSTSPAVFREQMDWLVKSATVINPSELEEVLSGRREVRRPVAVTFDDGYGSVFESAFPVLQELGIPFCIFLATQYIGEDFPLQGRRKRMLSWEQVSKMLDSGLLWLGSHTHSHRVLVECPPEETIEEVEISCNQIKRHTGIEPRYFAFPKGKSDAKSLDIIRRYFPLVFLGEGLQFVSSSEAQVVCRVGVVNGVTSRHFRWFFSSLYWKARSIRRSFLR